MAADDQPNCAPGSFPAEYALSKVARKEVTARHNSMVITQDWNWEKRPLLKSRKGFIIEEWARFVEVGLPLLFTNVGLVVCYHRSGCVCLQPRQGKWCGISDIHTCVQKIIITCPLQPPPPCMTPLAWPLSINLQHAPQVLQLRLLSYILPLFICSDSQVEEDESVKKALGCGCTAARGCGGPRRRIRSLYQVKVA